jgi:hypothetical protein
LDSTTLVYDEFLIRIYLQLDGRCFSANHHFVVCEHQLILDSATLVHDKLVEKLPEFIDEFVNWSHLYYDR